MPASHVTPSRCLRGSCFHSLSSSSPRVPPPSRTKVRALASTAHGTRSTQLNGVIIREQDLFIQAGVRLQNLLAGAGGDGEDDLIDYIVSGETPEAKMQAHIAIGGMMTLASVAVCSFAGQDPWGNMGLDLDTGIAAAAGALVAIPMVAWRAWTWSPAAAHALPALHDVHLAQARASRPWLSRMAGWHVALQCCLEVGPATLLLLPAAQGGLVAGACAYLAAFHGLLGEEGGVGAAVAAACLAATACMVGAVRGAEMWVGEEEYEVVMDALAHADRYYRTMAPVVAPAPRTPRPSMDSADGGDARGGQGEAVAAEGEVGEEHGVALHAAHAAHVFRCVARAWLNTKRDAALAAAATTAVDVLALGGLWYGTGNLAAPLVAGLAVAGVDYVHMHAAVAVREAKADARTAQGGQGDSGGPSAPAA